MNDLRLGIENKSTVVFLQGNDACPTHSRSRVVAPTNLISQPMNFLAGKKVKKKMRVWC